MKASEWAKFFFFCYLAALGLLMTVFRFIEKDPIALFNLGWFVFFSCLALETWRDTAVQAQRPDE